MAWSESAPRHAPRSIPAVRCLPAGTPLRAFACRCSGVGGRVRRASVDRCPASVARSRGVRHLGASTPIDARWRRRPLCVLLRPPRARPGRRHRGVRLAAGHRCDDRPRRVRRPCRRSGQDDQGRMLVRWRVVMGKRTRARFGRRARTPARARIHAGGGRSAGSCPRPRARRSVAHGMAWARPCRPDRTGGIGRILHAVRQPAGPPRCHAPGLARRTGPPVGAGALRDQVEK